MSGVVLGIDGGGTRTRASIVDGEKVLASAENGSIKRLRVGALAAEEHLRALLEQVYSQAGVNGVRAASAGVASSTMPGVREWITAVFDDFQVERAEIVGDEVIALDAAFRGGPGILQIAGTGTNCIGRASDGGRETAGGWSSRLGDEGSGYWIGLHALRRALRAYDRGEPTRILDVVGCAWGTATLPRSRQTLTAWLKTEMPSRWEYSSKPRLILSSRCCSCVPSCTATTISMAKFRWRGSAA